MNKLWKEISRIHGVSVKNMNQFEVKVGAFIDRREKRRTVKLVFKYKGDSRVAKRMADIPTIYQLNASIERAGLATWANSAL